jgi:hypothetical protein
LHRYQNLGILRLCFSTSTHLRGVSASDPTYALLCATSST